MADVLEDFGKQANDIVTKYMKAIDTAVRDCDALSIISNYGNLSGDFGELRKDVLHASEMSKKDLSHSMDYIGSVHMGMFKKVLEFVHRCECKKKEEVK